VIGSPEQSDGSALRSKQCANLARYFTGEEFFQRVRYGVRRPWPASASLALGKAPTTTRVTGDTSSTRLSATA
jgi:hypothetical protein